MESSKDLALTQNQLPQNCKDGKPNQTSQVRLLRLADSQRKINESTEVEVKSVLQYIFVLLGLNSSDIPDDIEKVVLLDFIFASYGVKYSCSDLKNAFVMGINGTFPVDTSLYGKRFSASYISRFMNAYDEYKSSMKRVYIDRAVDQNFEPIQPTPMDEETLKKASQRALEMFSDITTKSGIVPSIFDVELVYKALSDNFNIDIKHQEKYRMEAKREANKDVERVRLRYDSAEAMRTKKWYEERIEYYTKRALCVAYFESLLSSSTKESTASSNS